MQFKPTDKKVLYKSEICKKWVETGQCKYGKKCQYAHGIGELRTVPRHEKYKSKYCEKYHNGSVCPYGMRCIFVHRDRRRLGAFESVVPTTCHQVLTMMEIAVAEEFDDFRI